MASLYIFNVIPHNPPTHCLRMLQLNNIGTLPFHCPRLIFLKQPFFIISEMTLLKDLQRSLTAHKAKLKLFLFYSREGSLFNLTYLLSLSLALTHTHTWTRTYMHTILRPETIVTWYPTRSACTTFLQDLQGIASSEIPNQNNTRGFLCLSDLLEQLYLESGLQKTSRPLPVAGSQ